MQVADADHIRHGVVAELVRGAVANAALHAAARHPEAEAVLVVVAAIRALREGPHADG